MGAMKELVMNTEEKICDEIYEEAEECKNFADFLEIVSNAYAAEPLLCHTPKDYVQDVASFMWFEELGNTL